VEDREGQKEEDPEGELVQLRRVDRKGPRRAGTKEAGSFLGLVG
jgi:hypothetical protein